MAAAPATSAVPRLRTLAGRFLVPKVLLPLAFVASAFWLAYQAYHVNSFIWLIDELLYVKEAQGYADLQGLMPHVHGARYGVPNVLYPMLMAPLYAFFSAPDAFTLAHVLNGIAWASTMFPVYLLVRRLDVAWPWALLAGVLSVWVPWSVAVTVVMTEAVAYPAFAWAVLAMTVAVADPRPRHDALALLAILVTISARTQFVFLFAAYVLAVLLHALAVRDPGRAWWKRLRDHWALGALLVVGGIVVLAISLVDSDLLGGYGVVSGLPPFPNGLWLAAGVHAGHVVVGVGILPAILYGAWLFGVASEPPEDRTRPAPLAFAVVGAVTLGLLVYQAAFFMQNVGAVLQERYISYAAPILFVGMVAFAGTRHRVAPRLSIVVSSVVTAAIVAGAPHLETEAANAFDSVANGSSGYLQRTGPVLGDLTRWLPGRDFSALEAFVVITLLLGIAAAVACAPRWRRWAMPALCLLVLAYCVDGTRYVVPRAVAAIDSNFPYALTGARETARDWVDRATPDDSLVGAQTGTLGVPDEGNQWFWTVFWNESIQRTYSYDGRFGYSGWPGTAWKLDERTGRLSTSEQPDFLVVSQIDPGLRVQGQIVANSAYNAVVVEPAQPLRARWALDPTKDPDDPIRLFVYPETPGGPIPDLDVTLSAGTAPPEAGKVEVPFVLDDGTTVKRGKLLAANQLKFRVSPRPVGPDGRAVVTLRQRPQPVPNGEVTVGIQSVADVAP